jgi:hypothetical protein
LLCWESESSANLKCQLHAATVTVVFKFFNHTTGSGANETGSLSTPFSIRYVVGFQSKHEVAKSTFLNIGREARGFDKLFDIIDIYRKPREETS